MSGASSFVCSLGPPSGMERRELPASSFLIGQNSLVERNMLLLTNFSISRIGEKRLQVPLEDLQPRQLPRSPIRMH